MKYITLFLAGIFMSPVAAHSQSTGNLGTLNFWNATSTTWTGSFTGATLRIRSVSDSIFQIAYDDGADAPTVMIQTPLAEGPDLTVTELADRITLNNGTLRIDVALPGGLLTFLRSDGLLITSESSSSPYSKSGDITRFTFTEGPGQVFGFGEKGMSLNRKGQFFDTYNRANYGYSSALKTMKVNIPLMTTTEGYGVFFDSSYPANVDLRSGYSYQSLGGPMVFYFFTGDLRAQIRHYYQLTGFQPLPPRWALGFIQSKYGYQNETEVRQIASTFRSKNIPADAIVLDLYWFGQENKMGDLQWDLNRFPDPAGMVADLLDDGFRVIPIQETYFVNGTRLYSLFSAYVGKKPAGGAYTFGFWAGDARLFDVTHASAPHLWWSQSKAIMESGIAGWWTDLGEPETHPSDMIHAGGSAAKVHNIYNLIWAKILWDGFNKDYPGKRFFNLTRSGTGGMQRFATFPWSGDVDRSFDGLSLQPGIMLGMSLSGIGYEHSDLGGFAGSPASAELYTRWMQFGAFTGIMRAHTSHQNHEPWAFGLVTERITGNYIRIRHRLNPYFYTAAWNHSIHGELPIRPLLLDFPDLPGVSDRTDAFFFGPSLLVMPVLQPDVTSVNTDLPSGTWYDFYYPNAVVPAGFQTLAAPLQQIPVLVRGGSVIPQRPDGRTVADEWGDTLLLSVFPDRETGLASGSLIEDDGLTTQSLAGERLETRFLWEETRTDSMTAQLTSVISGTGYPSLPGSRMTHIRVARHGSWTRVQSGTTHLPYIADSTLWAQSNEPAWTQTSTHGMIRTTGTPFSPLNLSIRGSLYTSVRSEQPADWSLGTLYPNPFNPSVNIPVTIASPGSLRLVVHNVLGQQVAEKIFVFTVAGPQTLSWEPHQLTSGLYHLTFINGSKRETRRAVYLK
ncbi:MAG: T9SS type A sorting domain-containing protein [Bacteroidetes bacterium]|nr:T9SS type A sorting domain-containing protein [Bacteroidota bacterium]